ncbi:unnamed protein product [Urochloa decumbens]|uniref:FLZ-type domain-containing protein n=1 Tax=Urochloa decumbens TaxID=240449 RepID=A0ABC8WW47_9POAL
MLGKMAAGVTERRRHASFDRTGTAAVSPSPLPAPPPKLLLADDTGVVVSGVSPPPVPVEAAVVSPTSTLQAAAGSSPTSPVAAAVPFFSHHGASSSSSRGGDRRCKSRSHHRPAWEAAVNAGLGLAGALNGDAAAPPSATVLTGRSFGRPRASAATADRSAPRSSLMMSPMEMEASEGYTRVVDRGGPSTRTTHIFDGRVVVGVDGCGGVLAGGEDGDEFLRWCHGCSKDLGHGKDIFMYRGEMAFCSHECRYREMLLLGDES